LWGRLFNLRTDCQSVLPGVARLRVDTRAGLRRGRRRSGTNRQTYDNEVVARPKGKRKTAASPSLLAHAVDTFGSERIALRWLSSECGALNNQTPLQVIRDGNEAEVERILGCIDHGMIA
jgi:uncharacterized protein (DUF2384 family)